ncbi:Beta-ketoacyl-[acyl-carrier-protein] synthase I [Psidium guajava]|nr:Beta-ketoacyl-[acyl-carrier-protein] synthase I [Psidium guajava]
MLFRRQPPLPKKRVRLSIYNRVFDPLYLKFRSSKIKSFHEGKSCSMQLVTLFPLASLRCPYRNRSS